MTPVKITATDPHAVDNRSHYSGELNRFSLVAKFICFNHFPSLACWCCPLRGMHDKLNTISGLYYCSNESYASDPDGCEHKFYIIENWMQNGTEEQKKIASDLITELLITIDNHPDFELQYIKPEKDKKSWIREFSHHLLKD